MNRDGVYFKDEGGVGPVLVCQDGKWRNYQDDKEYKRTDGSYEAQWFTRAQARSFAKKLGLPLKDA
jgi:hypothetical protein